MGKITYINKSSCVIKNVKFKGNATIGPNAILCDCEIGDNAKIVCSQIYESQIGDDSFVVNSQIESSSVETNCEIGPFSHIRPGSKIGTSCRIGNFVEIKNPKLEQAAKFRISVMLEMRRLAKMSMLDAA